MKASYRMGYFRNGEFWQFVIQDYTNSLGGLPDDFWRTCVDDINYPLLAWQCPTADLLCPDGVNFIDFSAIAAQWRQPPTFPNADIAPSRGDNIVNELDLKAPTENWLTEFE